MGKVHQTRASLEPFFDLERNSFRSLHDDSIVASKHRLHWRCPEGHRWQMRLAEMLERQNPCQVCRRADYWKTNTLRERAPEIFRELHPERNTGIDVDKLKWRESEKVWWLCPRGHEYKTTVFTRTRLGTGCPSCGGGSSKAELRVYAEFSALLGECILRFKVKGIEVDCYIPSIRCGIEFDGSYWHRNKNEQDMAKNAALADEGIRLFRIREAPLEVIDPLDQVIPIGTDKYLRTGIKKLALTLSQHVEMPEKLQQRLRAYGQSHPWAAASAYRKLIARLPGPPDGKTLLDERPDLADEWDYVKNNPLRPEMFATQSHQRVFWRCAKGHGYRARIQSRVLAVGNGCKKCAVTALADLRRQVAAAGNPLNRSYPEVAAQWHPSLNGSLKSSDVSASSKLVAWWLCPEGHPYDMKVDARTKPGIGCPYCSGKRVGFGNSLADKEPAIAKSWCQDLNGSLTPHEVTPKSGQVVYWSCDRGHTWRQQIRARVEKGLSGCMRCRRLDLKFPEIAKEWHPAKNGELMPKDVSAHSGIYAWWICAACGHEWRTSIHKRTSSNAGCPKCSVGKKKESRRKNESFKYRVLDTHPDISLIWDYEKNTEVDLASMPSNSRDPVWLRCPNGHSYEQQLVMVTTRKNLLYCPVCKDVHARNDFSRTVI